MAQYSQIVVAVVALVLILSPLMTTRAMPLSWSRSSRHRRGIVEGTPSTQAPSVGEDTAGRLEQTGFGVHPSSTGGAGSDCDHNQTDSFSLCMERCYNQRISQERIAELNRFYTDNFDEFFHPAFSVSQWLENYHRQEFCSSRNFSVDPGNVVCEGPSFTNTIKENINNTLAQMGYKVRDFNQMRYPRYVVEVAECPKLECQELSCRTSLVKEYRQMIHLAYNETSSDWEAKSTSTAVRCVKVTNN